MTSSIDLDHEAVPLRFVLVRLDDGAGLHVDTNITIAITDLNEPPVFNVGAEGIGGVYTINFSSESVEGQNVGAPLSVFDPDHNDRSTFEMESACFDVGRLTGQITHRDRTTTNDCLTGGKVHNLFVDATDASGARAAVQRKVAITIIQSNRPPSVAAPITDLAVAENSPGGTVVGTLTATDPESHAVLWSIDPPSQLFAISTSSSSTGVVTLVAGSNGGVFLDYETRSVHTIYVVATESTTNDRLANSRRITILVTDLNERPTIVDAANRTVRENTMIGTTVGPAVEVFDPDNSTVLTYKIITPPPFEGGANPMSTEFFSLGTLDGIVRVAGQLDYETENFFSMDIRVTDEQGLTSTSDATIEVYVMDINEPPSVEIISMGTDRRDRRLADGSGSGNNIVSVLETATAGQLLYTITAFDHETPISEIRLTVGDGDGDVGAGLFVVINSVTIAGAFDVQLATDNLDYERTSLYSVYVCAVDDGGLRACVDVEVRVTDVLDTTIESFGGDIDHGTAGGDVVDIFGSNFG